MVKRLKNDKQREALKEIKTSFINGLTLTQVENEIDNITDLSSAKSYLKKLSKVVFYLLKNSNLQ